MARRSILAAAALAMAATFPAQAGQVAATVAGMSFRLPIVSLKEARFKNVVKQEYDFSCGSAALATLLTHHYRRPISETEAFRAMFDLGDREAIQQYGFSLYDMQLYLKSLGLKADGFQMPLDRFATLGVPGIALINTRGYNHFVVIKGVRGDKVLFGDPALGMKAVPKDEFRAMWEGIVFLIRDDVPIGRASFNRDEEWRTLSKAPYGTALSRNGIATFSLMLPGLNEF